MWITGQIDTKVQVEGQQRKALSAQMTETQSGWPKQRKAIQLLPELHTRVEKQAQKFRAQLEMLQQRPLETASPWYS